MKRNFTLPLAACAPSAPAVLAGAFVPQAQSVGLFDSRALDASSVFAVLARPVGRPTWSLLVLEQL